MDFKGANVIITGGSSGIGKATAKLLAGYGANVFIIARDQAKLDQAFREIEERRINPEQRFRAFSADVRDSEQIKNLVVLLVEENGPPHLLINSAGICQPGYFEGIPLSVFQEEMATNYFGTLHAIRAVLPHMVNRGGGHIVNISSVAGFVGGFGYSSYAASKFALCGLSEVLSSELKPFNIGISVLLPFDTDTPMLEGENKTKPLETKILTGAIKPQKLSGWRAYVAWGLIKLFTPPPASPEQVAMALVKGIQRGDFLIIPDFGMKLLYYIGPLKLLLNWVSDQAVVLARKQGAVRDLELLVPHG